MSCNVYQSVKRGIVSKRDVSRIAERMLAGLGRNEADASVHVIGDARMKALNRRYRGVGKTTDVLSFPTETGENDLGDLFISAPQIRRQAKELGIPAKEEFVRMLSHGILHLAGYNHEKKRESEKMFGLQEKLVERLNIVRQRRIRLWRKY